MSKIPNLFVIVDPTHPHTGEMGSIQLNEKGNVVIRNILGKKMVTIDLINCSHGTLNCMVSANKIQHIRE